MTTTAPSTALPSSHHDNWALNLTNVHKTYRGKVHALRGVSMQVARGEIFGLLGPNGAGKSTLVKILMTVIRSPNCQGTVLGGPVGHKPTLARIGYLPEHHRFPEYLTGGQVIDHFGALCGTPRRDRRKRSAELLELVGMKDWANKKVKSYSKGMRQRVGIAQALVNDPDLVLLDEPTDGVDPVGRREIRNILTHIKEHGKTVFLNSHLLSELEMVCDRVAIMVQGKVVSQGTIDELTKDQQHYEIEIEGPPPPDAQEIVSGSLGHAIRVELQGSTLRLGTTDSSAVQPALDRLRAHRVVIRAVRPVRPSLEDLFMQAVVDPTTGLAKSVGAAKEGRP